MLKSLLDAYSRVNLSRSNRALTRFACIVIMEQRATSDMVQARGVPVANNDEMAGTGDSPKRVQRYTNLPEEVSRALENSNTDDAKAFLADVLAEDERASARFMATFGPRDVKAQKKALRSELASIRRAHAYRGFIDYREARPFEREYQDAIESFLGPASTRGDADALFELLETVVMHFRRISIDDSDGFVTDTFALLSDYYHKAFLRLEGSKVERGVKRLCSLAHKIATAKEEAELDWFLVPELYRIPAELYADDAGLAPVIVKLCDFRLAELTEKAMVERAEYARRVRETFPGAPASTRNAAMSTFRYKSSAEYEADRWACYRVRALSAAGHPLDEVEDFALAHADSADVLLALADACEVAGNASRAMDDLERAIDQPQEVLGSGGIDKLRLRLVSLYHAAGRTDREQELLVELLQQHRPPQDVSVLDLLHRVKATVQQDQWPGFRKSLLSGMSSRYALCDCLVDEGMTEEVYRLAKQTPDFDIHRYETVLVGVDPSFVIDRYRQEAVDEFGHAYDRRGYRSAAKRLAHLATISGGGSKAAKDTAREMRNRYPRKTALDDELSKAGFSRE